MIYITGDTHGDFSRFTKESLSRLPFEITENDYVIVCGDFGLLWSKGAELEYNLKKLSKLPFKILWVQGNHESYTMIAEYPLKDWNGGKVRHIIRDKIILLERGQVFTIEGKTFFTFGGASSHDVQGGILDMTSPTYEEDKIKAIKSGLPYRVLNKSWWKQELPTDEELQEGLRNLEKCDFNVDYVISHCASDKVVKNLFFDHRYINSYRLDMVSDVLTQYFDELENKLNYKRWYFGHYHDDLHIDYKHTLLYYNIEPLD